MNSFTRIWKFIIGYVTITIEGYFLEKFTNLCTINNIPFWNVKRYGNAKMVGRTTLRGFKQMRFQAKKCGCRVRLEKKRGTPFLLHKYRKRKIFVIGFITFFICIKVASMFIWQIEVSGNKIISENSIINTLNELGIKEGILKDSLDVRNLANLFMTKRDDITWVGIEVNGIKVNVKVVEKEKVPDKIDDDTPCDIIALKPALIISMDTYRGTPVAKAGDIVDKGTILVEGIMEMKQFPDKTELVHSLASIKGKVWYERTRSLKLSEFRNNNQLEEFAYNLAYKNIENEIPDGAEILSVSKSVAYTNDKVIVTVTVESLEEIGEELLK